MQTVLILLLLRHSFIKSFHRSFQNSRVFFCDNFQREFAKQYCQAQYIETIPNPNPNPNPTAMRLMLLPPVGRLQPRRRLSAWRSASVTYSHSLIVQKPTIDCERHLWLLVHSRAHFSYSELLGSTRIVLLWRWTDASPWHHMYDTQHAVSNRCQSQWKPTLTLCHALSSAMWAEENIVNSSEILLYTCMYINNINSQLIFARYNHMRKGYHSIYENVSKCV